MPSLCHKEMRNHISRSLLMLPLVVLLLATQLLGNISDDGATCEMKDDASSCVSVESNQNGNVSLEQHERNEERLELESDVCGQLNYSDKRIGDLFSGHALRNYNEDRLLSLRYIEILIQEFRLDYYFEYPKRNHWPLKLSYTHLYAAIILIPNSDHEDYILDGTYQLYHSRNNLPEMLLDIRSHHKGPSIITINTKNMSQAQVQQYAVAILNSATYRDIILLEGNVLSITDMQKSLCKLYAGWEIYHGSDESGIYILKSASLTKNMVFEHIPPPDLILATKTPHCDPQLTKVDVILMTRNRPLQTFAYLESLSHYVKNINKVWVLFRADSDIFKDGYKLAFSCASNDLDIIGVQDQADEFGLKLDYVISKSDAQYIVLGVDEQIWLAPVDLQYSACLLSKGEGIFHSFQLRLGYNYRYPPFNKSSRFFPMKHNPSVHAYYPRHTNGDFGYLLNVDGNLLSKADFEEDMRELLPKLKHPGNLENRWMHRKMHVRVKQWHLMYNHSRVTNNMYLRDGRMADHFAHIKQAAFDHAEKFVKAKQKIDVKRFAHENFEHGRSHIAAPVSFIELEC